MAKDTRRPYSRMEFVNRPEIGAIIEAVKDLSQGRPVDLRAFSLTDESGMGKTWALHHLSEMVLEPDKATGVSVRSETGDELRAEVPGARSLYVDLRDWSSHFDGDIDPERTIRYLIMRISQQISDWGQAVPTGIRGVDVETVPLADLSRWLEADVRRFTRGSVFVPLFDQVHEARWALLERLDQFLLGPLAAIPRVLPIVAGRGQSYRWKSPEMYLHCESLKLRPFDKNQTEEQIEKQVPNEEDRRVLLQKIHALSGGYPRLSYAIATLGEDRGLHAELDTVLEVVTDEAVRTKLKDYVGAICVLRSFDDDRTVKMMDTKGESVTRSKAADVRKELMQHSFAFWPEKAKGWVLDGGLRFTSERLLRLEAPDLFVSLQQAAYDLYAGWCASYPNAKDTWQPEADYHAQQLKQLRNLDPSKELLQ